MSEIYEFEFGDYRGVVLKDSSSEMPADNAFAQVDETERQQALMNSPYDNKTIELSMNVLILERDGQRVMIETGNSANDPNNAQLFPLLEQADIAPESLDIVTISHAHADHYCGMLDAEGNKRFPNARYVMWQPEWEYYTSDEQMAREHERGQARHDFIQQYLGGLAPYMEFVTPDNDMLTENIQMIPARGHSIHHMRFEITSQGKTLHVIGDSFIHPLCLNYPHWTFPFDADDDTAIATRQQLRDDLQGDWVLAYHFPFPGIGTIHLDGNQYLWQPL